MEKSKANRTRAFSGFLVSLFLLMLLAAFGHSQQQNSSYIKILTPLPNVTLSGGGQFALSWETDDTNQLDLVIRPLDYQSGTGFSIYEEENITPYARQIQIDVPQFTSGNYEIDICELNCEYGYAPNYTLINKGAFAKLPIKIADQRATLVAQNDLNLYTQYPTFNPSAYQLDFGEGTVRLVDYLENITTPFTGSYGYTDLVAIYDKDGKLAANLTIKQGESAEYDTQKNIYLIYNFKSSFSPYPPEAYKNNLGNAVAELRIFKEAKNESNQTGLNNTGSPTFSSTGCTATPALSINATSATVASGHIVPVQISVTGTQPASCGVQTYGVDFTNAFAGKDFSLAITGKQERNLFNLSSGQTKTFNGLIGVPPGTLAGNYSIQVTAYAEADHWNQASQSINVEASPSVGYTDNFWSNDMYIGWYQIPYVEGTGAYGCPNITKAYRYSPYKQDYVEMDRYGPVFAPAQNEPDIANEKFGGMFVFSTQRCTISGMVPAAAYENASVSLKGGQLLGIPPAWNNAKVQSVLNLCTPLYAKHWDSGTQTWQQPNQSSVLKAGEVWSLFSKSECNANLGEKP